MINTLIVVYFFFFLIHTIVFLLYQFDVVNIRERSMVYWIRAVNIIETLFLAIIHIFTFSSYGTYFLGAIYLLNITLLVLQFIFAEWGFGRKVLDFFWIGFYTLLFLIDVLKIGLPEIVSHFSSSESIHVLKFIFSDTIIGKLILGVATPVLRTVILEAIHRNE